MKMDHSERKGKSIGWAKPVQSVLPLNESQEDQVVLNQFTDKAKAENIPKQRTGRPLSTEEKRKRKVYTPSIQGRMELPTARTQHAGELHLTTKKKCSIWTRKEKSGQEHR